MRVKGVKSSIYLGLKDLPWRPSYLAAMWILCGELQSLYADWIGDDEVPLIESTMGLVREVIIDGESPQAMRRAADLANSWERVIDAQRGTGSPRGLRNTFKAFAGLAHEIAGLSGHYFAGNWVPNAAEDRWKDWGQPGRIVVVNWDEEADDDSPTAQTLTLFGRVVSEVGSLQGFEWDPEIIREQIFGGRRLTGPISARGPRA